MKKTIAIALALLALGLAGCRSQCTANEGRHTWSKWTNEWEQTNPWGYMRQTRTCEICGLFEIEVVGP